MLRRLTVVRFVYYYYLCKVNWLRQTKSRQTYIHLDKRKHVLRLLFPIFVSLSVEDMHIDTVGFPMYPGYSATVKPGNTNLLKMLGQFLNS